MRSKEGRLARVCQGILTCPKKGQLYYKIDRLAAHLRECHGYNGPIQFGRNGRPPKGHEVHKESNVDIYLSQRQKRFLMVDRKFDLAMVEHEKRLRARASLAWNTRLDDVERATFAGVLEYVDAYTKSGMATYMANKDAKLASKHIRIAKGWEANVRP